LLAPEIQVKNSFSHVAAANPQILRHNESFDCSSSTLPARPIFEPMAAYKRCRFVIEPPTLEKQPENKQTSLPLSKR
jgi:hypothetical protein